jgi:hypothetical protein
MQPLYKGEDTLVGSEKKRGKLYAQLYLFA